MGFQGINFKGTFRTYQDAVLRESNHYIDDGRIHIVASPGSGKTVLGLELIRRLDAPAIILAPTITIRDQWGSRFARHFLPDGAVEADYVSFDLRHPKLLTAVTYQGLHAAFHRLIDEEREEDAEVGKTIDYAELDLLQTMRDAGIKTVCLDEAHHLRSEWQKTLERVLAELADTVKVIALTATPPYDAAPVEWNRYISTCGEIDAEIFVPELVFQKTLCPHQDYVYFGCPGESEAALIRDHRRRTEEAVAEIADSDIFRGIIAKIVELYPDRETELLEAADDHLALLAVAERATAITPVPKKMIRLLSPDGRVPRATLLSIERGFQFILESEDRFGKEAVDWIEHKLKSYGLIERRRIALVSNAMIRKAIVGSIGKLDGIRAIAAAESASLGSGLRMLILTDFIKRDLTHILGNDEPLTSINTVTVFAAVTRTVTAPTAVLSGSLTIVPTELVAAVQRETAAAGGRITAIPLSDGKSSEIVFSGGNRIKVAVLTNLFERGMIKILIGTAALLGEGWDSPGINALILASFVGTSMLSNQMRGRAIRVNPAEPGKTANVWHLSTVEPDHPLKPEFYDGHGRDVQRPRSFDFESLSRRFESFIGPAYDGSGLQSGIDRITLIKPPYTKEGIDAINRAMLAKAADREAMKNAWTTGIAASPTREILEVDEVPKRVFPMSATYLNATLLIALTYLEEIVIRAFADAIRLGDNALSVLVLAIIALAMLYGSGFLIFRIVKHASPERTIRTLAQAVLRTMRDMGVIESRSARLEVRTDPYGIRVECGLKGASAHEKNRFAAAIAELLSPIDSPRYLLIRLNVFGRHHYRIAFAVPGIIGANGGNVAILARHLAASTGKFDVVFTRSETGRRELLKCRRRAIVNGNQAAVERRKKMNGKRR